MFIEIITPDDKLFEGEVDSATFPGTDGIFQVLNDHAPMVSSLGKGDLIYQWSENDRKKQDAHKISGGVVEVLNNRVQVLVESIL